MCKIFDLTGKKVVEFKKSGNSGTVEWGKSSNVKTGLYFAKVTFDKGIHEVKKAIILK